MGVWQTRCAPFAACTSAIALMMRYSAIQCRWGGWRGDSRAFINNRLQAL